MATSSQNNATRHPLPDETAEQTPDDTNNSITQTSDTPTDTDAVETETPFDDFDIEDIEVIESKVFA